MKLIQTQDYLLLIDEEAGVKKGNYIYETDTLLINNVGKDYICNDKDFKIIAYYPLKEAKELDLPELPNPFKRRDYSDLEAEKLGQEYTISIFGELDDFTDITEGFKAGYKASQSKQFSLEDMEKAFHTGRIYQGREGDTTFDKFIQSLSTQQLPKEFIPEFYANGDMIFRNRNGVRELVGTYKY